VRFFSSKTLCAFAISLALSAFASVQAATVPSDDEQEILIRTTLMTFNDANLTGNYSVLYDKSAKVFRDQMSAEKLSAGFKVFRDKKVNLDSVVIEEIDSTSKPRIDSDGVLQLKGKFKDDDKQIRFDLKFVQEGEIWKMIGINVNYKAE
jgi:opacity protein-like surface antigen